jgi:hypothetical protein
MLAGPTSARGAVQSSVGHCLQCLPHLNIGVETNGQGRKNQMAKPVAIGRMSKRYPLMEGFQRGKLSSASRTRQLLWNNHCHLFPILFLNGVLNSTYNFPTLLGETKKKDIFR